jgi:isopentenyl-diphosphate delta-isomerase
MIAMCDKKGNILGEIEKWEAHKKGILHRAFTVAIVHKNKLLVQHRKHVAFDGVFDVTISSHQLMVNGKLEDTVQSTLSTLKREWNITKNDLVKPIRNDGAVYYKARDQYSEFIEHEVCDILVAEIKSLKLPNFDFAYGYSIVTRKELYNKSSHLYKNLAPWVKVMIKNQLL